MHKCNTGNVLSQELASKSPNAWYKAINEQYFSGLLPKVPVRFVNARSIDGCMGRTKFLVKGWKPVEIRIDAALKKRPALAAMTLLHEMAHVSVAVSGNEPDIDDHGPVWTAVMRRLANAGAFDVIW